MYRVLQKSLYKHYREEDNIDKIGNLRVSIALFNHEYNVSPSIANEKFP